ETLAYFLKQTGFTHIITANNHSADKGKKGIIGTIQGLQKFGLEQIGTYTDSIDKKNRYPFLFRKNKINFALLNYTYGTNGVKIPSPTIVNLIDTTEILKDLEISRSRGAEFIIMTFHWGYEKNNHYHRSQKEIADFCVRNGVDLIIGSHPHFIQEIETVQVTWNGKPKTCWIIYSLGNFISNQRWRYADGGLFWDCTIQKNHNTNEIQFIKTGFVPIWVYKQSNPIKYFLVPVPKHEKSPLYTLNSKDSEDFRIFAADTRKLIQGHLPQIQEIKEW
ncbi:MAG: CapA family protein, partial [Bacteroidia bacterium]|nr:CapA family protein [Bacteroidia bacterium]